MFTLAAVRADPVELARELQDLEQLRQRVVESLLSGVQGPRHRHLLRVKLSALNGSIASTRQTLSEIALVLFARYPEGFLSQPLPISVVTAGVVREDGQESSMTLGNGRPSPCLQTRAHS
jgi:hypothetical protein